MKCQILFSGKIKKNINLLSVENALSVVKVKESLYTAECVNGEQRPGWYFAYAQDDLNLLILCMFEDNFLLIQLVLSVLAFNI